MRKLFTIASFCVALGIATPCRAALIDIGSISLIDFGLGAEIRIENTTTGLTFGDRLVEDAFTDLVLTVGGVEYAFARVDDFADFYPAGGASFIFEPLLAGMGVSFLNFDPFVTTIDATVAFSFGGQVVQGGGPLVLFDTPISLFADIDESPASVPEPGTLLLLGAGLSIGAGRMALRPRRRDPAQ